MPVKRYNPLKFFTWEPGMQKYVCNVKGCIYRTKWANTKVMSRHLIDSHRDLVYYDNRTHKIERSLWAHRRDFIALLGAGELIDEIDKDMKNGGK